MSGPNDSVAGDTTGDLILQPAKIEPQIPSARFRLRLLWDTPRLEWRPQATSPLLPLEPPAFLKLDDPFAVVLRMERYIRSGGLLFDMRLPRFDLIDKAFLAAPTDPVPLLPSFAQMQAAQDEAFYKRLGRAPPLFGAPASAPLMTPPMLAPPPPSPFYKLPDPATMRGEPAAPKAGSAGDILKALHGLPIVQEQLNKLADEGERQVQFLKREWINAPWRDRILAISLAAPVAAGVVGAILGPDDARHFAFKSLKGVDVPVPFVPGLSLRIDNYGKADPYLLGAKPGDQAQPLQFGLKWDLLKALPELRKAF
jgi:hypothetical protein